MDNYLLQYTKLVPFLGKVMGRPFEIILFDLSKYDFPIIASENIKDSTAEKARDFVRTVLKMEDIQSRDYWVNYPNMIDSVRISKMSVYFIRNGQNEICAALVICMRCEEFFKMESFLNSILTFNNVDIEEGTEENFILNDKKNDREMSLDKIAEYIQEFGVDPSRTNHDEKAEIICDLYDMGIYNLKGAVAKTADELGISIKSVYRYLSKIKKARE